MNRKNIETELGKINFAYRKGDPLVVFLNGFGSFDTAQSFSKVIEVLPCFYFSQYKLVPLEDLT